jgi:hypothetical protein
MARFDSSGNIKAVLNRRIKKPVIKVVISRAWSWLVMVFLSRVISAHPSIIGSFGFAGESNKISSKEGFCEKQGNKIR